MKITDGKKIVTDVQAAIDYLVEVAGEYEDMHVFVDDECVNN